MANNIFDQHLHSDCSYDAARDYPMSDIASAAISRGIKGIAITDHLDPLWPDDGFPSILDIPRYKEMLTRTEQEFGARIRFAKGIELGLLPGEALDICEDVVSSYPFDFVIGSVHTSARTPIDSTEFHEGRAIEEIADEYYTILFECIKNYKNYDVLGHLNSIDRYTDGFVSEDFYMPYADEIMCLAIADGKGIEVNTSAFRYGLAARGTPTPAILRRYKELGGEIVTIGSDAHRVSDVGAYLKEGEEMLLAAGLRYVAVFSNREPEFFKLGV